MSSVSDKVKAWTYLEGVESITQTEIELPPLADDMVQVKIKACGLCYSDVAAKHEHSSWFKFPLVCGHEGIGVVTAVGSSVKDLKANDRVGVGPLRYSCGNCEFCSTGKDNLCSKKLFIFSEGNAGAFSESVRIHHKYAFKIPDQLTNVEAAPLMCAGLTVYTPFKTHNIKPGQKLGIVGIGGLGHLAIQFGRKWGCEVFALSTSDSKRDLCTQLGANHFINTNNEEALKSVYDQLNFIFITATDEPNINMLVQCLKPTGTVIMLGIPMKPLSVNAFPLMFEKSVTGSSVGSASDCSEMLKFATAHNIKPITQTFKFSEINTAFDLVKKNQVRFRAVLVNDD